MKRTLRRRKTPRGGRRLKNRFFMEKTSKTEQTFDKNTKFFVFF